MRRHLHYDGEQRTSYVHHQIVLLAIGGAIITFIFTLWGGGDFITDFIENQFELAPFISNLAVSAFVWLLLLLVGYKHRQFASHITKGAFLSGFISIIIAIVIWLNSPTWLLSFYSLLGVKDNFEIIGITSLFLFVIILLVRAIILNKIGYSYD